MRNNEKLVPELRFKEFESTWKEGKVKDLVVFHNNKRTPISKIERTKMEKKYPYYGAAGVIDHVNFYRFEGDYVLYGEDGTLGKSFLTDGRFCVSNHAHVLKSKTSNEFLYQLLKNLNWKLYNTGTIQPKLNKVVFESVSLKIPQFIEEQERISTFLSKVDKRITLLKQIKDLNKQYKKGLLQQMFVSNSVGGVLNVPSLRFKGFEGDWKSVKLGDMCSITTGKLDSKDAVDGGKYMFFTCSKKPLKINSYTHNTEAVLIAGSGSVGNIKYYKGKFNVQQRVYILDNFKCDVVFIKKYLDLKLPKRIIKETQTGIIPNISMSTTKDMGIKIPSIEEQIKISNFLTQVDNNYNKLDKELEELKQWKKGLLQRMFV